MDRVRVAAGPPAVVRPCRALVSRRISPAGAASPRPLSLNKYNDCPDICASYLPRSVRGALQSPAAVTCSGCVAFGQLCRLAVRPTRSRQAGSVGQIGTGAQLVVTPRVLMTGRFLPDDWHACSAGRDRRPAPRSGRRLHRATRIGPHERQHRITPHFGCAPRS